MSLAVAMAMVHGHGTLGTRLIVHGRDALTPCDEKDLQIFTACKKLQWEMEKPLKVGEIDGLMDCRLQR